MRRYILTRLLQAVVSMIALSLIVFFLARLTGDPRDVLLGDDYSQEQWDRLGELWHLDEPIYVQYAIFVRNALTGNFGESIFWKEPAVEMLVAAHSGHGAAHRNRHVLQRDNRHTNGRPVRHQAGYLAGLCG